MPLAAGVIFFPQLILPYEKSLYVRTSFFIRVCFREQLKFSNLNLAGKATTDQTLTIKFSRRDVDYRVKYEIRSGLVRKKDIIGLNAYTGEACFTVYRSKFNILIAPGYISTIPLRRNFYRPRKYLLWSAAKSIFLRRYLFLLFGIIKA